MVIIYLFIAFLLYGRQAGSKLNTIFKKKCLAYSGFYFNICKVLLIISILLFV